MFEKITRNNFWSILNEIDIYRVDLVSFFLTTSVAKAVRRNITDLVDKVAGYKIDDFIEHVSHAYSENGERGICIELIVHYVADKDDKPELSITYYLWIPEDLITNFSNKKFREWMKNTKSISTE